MEKKHEGKNNKNLHGGYRYFDTSGNACIYADKGRGTAAEKKEISLAQDQVLEAGQEESSAGEGAYNGNKKQEDTKAGTAYRSIDDAVWEEIPRIVLTPEGTGDIRVSMWPGKDGICYFFCRALPEGKI